MQRNLLMIIINLLRFYKIIILFLSWIIMKNVWKNCIDIGAVNSKTYFKHNKPVPNEIFRCKDIHPWKNKWKLDATLFNFIVCATISLLSGYIHYGYILTIIRSLSYLLGLHYTISNLLLTGIIFWQISFFF